VVREQAAMHPMSTSIVLRLSTLVQRKLRRMASRARMHTDLCTSCCAISASLGKTSKSSRSSDSAP
jgi:hypothetical protein